MSQSSKKPTLWFECIPDDIVFDLLNHMPVKSLIRFMCVSKSFYSTITSPDFINKHLHRAKLLSNNNNHNGYLLCKPKPKPLFNHNNHKGVLLCKPKPKPLFNHNNHKGVLLCKPKPKPKPVASSSEEELCTVVYNRDRTLTEICRFKIPFDNVRIVGFCNGIFCYTNYHSYSYPYCRQDYNGIIYLWNPSIRKFKKILATPLYKYFRWDTFGFAYHSQNNEFKVLRIVSFFPNEKLLNIFHVAHVYMSSTNSWRKVDFLLESPITRIVRRTLFFNGALHYIAYNGRHKFILSFDLNDEIFREITLPQNPPQNLHGTYTLDHLAVFKGSLAWISFSDRLCHMWVMKEYGVVESWTEQIVTIENFRAFLGCTFLGCTNCGELLFAKSIDPFELFSFDPESRDENNLRIQDLTPAAYTTNFFMDSLVLLNELELL